MFNEYEKIKGIVKIQGLNLPTPDTVFVLDIDSQKNEVKSFLDKREFVMIRSESINQSTHCPRKIKCGCAEAEDFIKELNSKGYTAILQDYVPLNNKYSGNILMLNQGFIIEAMRGGPVSKLNREGRVDEHLRVDRNGRVLFRKGDSIIPEDEMKQLINRVKDLPLMNHILEFSSGPDWFYFWHAREDKTSKRLEL